MTHFPQPLESNERWADERGWLQLIHESNGMAMKRSFSYKGVFRGLHVQRAPSLQTKIIRVVKGRIIDFVVALDDPAKAINARELVPDDGWIIIAANLAHGFYALEDTLFEYVCDGGYDEAREIGFSIVDHLSEHYGITDLILSAKDQAAPLLSESE
jgi:dTDP-4-dehydrorhamnose 3,5-epimerase